MEGGLANPADINKFNERCDEIYNALRKLRREASGFLTTRDKAVVEDLGKNMREYLRHYQIYEMVQGMYD